MSRPYTLAHNARYTKLRRVIECMKWTFLEQLEMTAIAQRNQSGFKKGIISEMSVSSLFGLKYFRAVCASKEREVNILEDSCMVSKQHNRNVCVQAILTIGISCYLAIPLINYWICPMLQVFLLWNLCNILCNVFKGFIERNFLHV